MADEIERSTSGEDWHAGKLLPPPPDGWGPDSSALMSAGPPPAIAVAPQSVGRPTWQHELKRAFREATALCRYLELPPEVAARAAGADGGFSLFAPYPYVDRIRRGDADDPLLKQILPVPAEREIVAGFSTDPVADLAAQTPPGVIRKYAGRALLITSGACAVHCRYCFRRHFPYAEAPHSVEQWRAPLRQLADDTTLRELILSGGDPLTLRDELLGELLDEITVLPRLRCLRIHTRLPVVIPQRVTDALLAMLASRRWNVVLVLHVNHPREIDAEVAEAVCRLRGAGALLLNQAVLLRGVNDDLATLTSLSESLIDVQIVPYYLHQLDRVAGAAHFAVPEARGRALVRQLQQSLPGYAVPRYVQDVPGHESKHWLLG